MDHKPRVTFGVKEFDALGKRDFENGAVRDEIRRALADNTTLRALLGRALWALRRFDVGHGAAALHRTRPCLFCTLINDLVAAGITPIEPTEGTK